MTIRNAMFGVSEKNTGSDRDPAKTKVVSIAPKVGGGRGGDFESSPVDLSEIGRAYYSDSYIMRAINKIVGLMFKSGWGFNSSNSDALEYVIKRFALIAESTDISTQELVRELGFNYVLYSNSALIKVRGTENIADLEATGYYGGDPIAGLFNVPVERLEVERDDYGNIESYLILSDEGDDLELSPEDVIHFTHNKPTGRTFGVPHVSSVIDDVLILRQIEENVVRMIYRNIHPLMTYRVGLAEPGYEADDDEITAIAAEIENMPLDSMIVLSERHKIETVSSNSGILDAYNYLKYFRQRVFTGLGVSESTMGIGDSSNRSTADNQSSDLIDLVKDFQINFESSLQILVNEILFEGGFDPVLNEEDRVTFDFVEIEQNVKIARENHELMKYLSNAQSLDSFLHNIGEDPIEDSELDRFYQNLFGGNAKNDPEGQVDNKNKPENQHGKQDSPVKDPKESIKEANAKKNQIMGLTNENEVFNLRLDSENYNHTANELKDTLTELLEDVKENPQSKIKIIQKWKDSIEEKAFNDPKDKDAFISAVEVGFLLEDVLDGDASYMLSDSILSYYNHLLKGGE